MNVFMVLSLILHVIVSGSLAIVTIHFRNEINKLEKEVDRLKEDINNDK